MALPSMVVTGNLKEILGNVASSELVESALSRARILFTANVPNDAFVKWDGSLYRVLPVQAIVNNDGDIVLDDGDEGPVRLLAQDDGLDIRGLQWQARIDIPSNVLPIAPSGRMRPFWFNALGDGETINLKAVAPSLQAPLTGTEVQVPASIDDLSGVSTFGKSLVGSVSQDAARAALGAVPVINVKSYGALGNIVTEDTGAIQTAINAAAALRTTLAATNYQNITVYFPPGRYTMGAITVPSGIRLDGDAAILQPTPGFTGTLITLAGQYARLGQNLYIRGNAVNGEQAVVVNASCYHNHISSTFQNWGGKVIVDNAGGTHIDSRFIEGMRNTAYINSFAAGEYIGVVELKGSDAGYIIGSEINASRYTYGGTGLGASTNGVVTPLLVSGCNALVYGAVCENGDVGVVVPATGPFGAPRWNHFIAVRGEFNYQHGFLLLGGSGVIDACRTMGNSRSTDNTGDGFHFDAGTWTINGCHSTSEFPADGKSHRYGLYKATGATVARSTFRSTSDHNAYYDGTTAFSTMPDQSPNIANVNAVDGQRVLKITAEASAVNYLEMVSRATGAPAYIAAQGDGNRDFGLQPRGTGGIFVYQPSGAEVVLKAQGAATDVGWNLTTKGAGVVKANGVQVATTAQTAALQPLDSDLTAFAAISPANDDIVQRKAGAWTNRTMAQLKTDLSLTFGPAEIGEFWTPPGFGYTSGNYYFFTSGATAGTSLNAVNRLLLAWVVLPKAVTIQSVFGEITTVGAAGSVMRIGIYNDDGTFKPGTLALDCGTIDGTSATVQEITGLSKLLPAGGYWVGGVCQSSGTVPTVRSVATTSQPVPSLFSMGTSLPAAGGGATAYGVSSVTGALASTVASFTSSGAPRIGFKVA